MDKLKKFLNLTSLGGEFSELYDNVQNGTQSMAFGLVRPEKLHIVSQLNKFVLYIAKDKIEASNIFKGLQDYYSSRVTLLEASDDMLIYRKKSPTNKVALRLKSLIDIMSGNVDCCVTTVDAIAGFFPNKARLAKNNITLTKGQKIDLYYLVDKLIELGYSRESVVEEKNTFSLAGDILCLFPSDRDLPIRISFFDDEIESIKPYELESRLSPGELPCVDLLCNNEFMLSNEEYAKVIKMVDDDISRLTPTQSIRAREIYAELSNISANNQQIQWLLPYFRTKMSTIFDYLPHDSVIVLDEPTVLDNIYDLTIKEHINRTKMLVEDGDCLPCHSRAIMDKSNVYSSIKDFCIVGFDNIRSSNAIFSPQSIVEIKSGKLGNYAIHFEALYDDIRSFLNAGYYVIMCCGDSYKAKAMQANLEQEGIDSTYQEGELQRKHGISVTPIDLAKGFCYPFAKLAIIGREDISKKRVNSIGSKNKVFTMPQVGDYVVHEVHGIGHCMGINRIKTGTIEQDYVVIEYRKQEKLYVPIDQLDRISRYSGSEVAPKLSIIGGKDFEKVKDNVRKSVKAMAIDLVELYGQRQSKLGCKYPSDTIWQEEFEASFIYEETPDQLQAIEDCKSDMERGIIMDRLLCGDVGYGKTEVALRAIFKTIMESKQAVILAPTTILARQHYNTATERFAQFGINIELITRFQTPQQIEKSLNNLATGKSLVAVATHRILSKDVSFADLGLLVLDEEQRFGVEHKEKLKVIKNNVNVLTMSATPIPRTLNMALTGIRDISVLETPPHNRLPVQTSITELTNGLLHDCISRELNRNGQVYVLYNRVETIDKFAKEVQQLVPEARIVVGHGQMLPRQLEDTINDFYTKQADVLICTTIIENGIDIPDANTLIVCDADRLGLSQLYQLRGRVGRSNRIAYAYFTIPQGKVLTGDAAKRLTAIMDYTQLGSGFKIAMRDLEIRGAGNVLGKEQHGHIQKVGYDLYCKLLKECIDQVQGIEIEKEQDVKIKVNIDTYLASDYISDENTRLRIYREIADLQTIEAKQNLLDNLKENFGTPPQPTINLVELGLIKNIAKEYGICQINITEKGAGFVFQDAQCYNNPRLMGLISEWGDKCLLNYDTQPKLIFDCKWMLNVQKFNLLKAFLMQLGKN